MVHGMCILKYFACFLWCYGSSWGGTSVGTILLPQFYSLVSGRASQGFPMERERVEAPRWWGGNLRLIERHRFRRQDLQTIQRSSKVPISWAETDERFCFVSYPCCMRFIISHLSETTTSNIKTDSHARAKKLLVGDGLCESTRARLACSWRSQRLSFMFRRRVASAEACYQSQNMPGVVAS